MGLVSLDRRITEWRLRTRTLALGQRTRVMGVVNITPDSFSDGGLYFAPEAAVKHALGLLEQGADLLDLGAESTRPGARVGGDTATVSADEEQARLLPVIEGILKARPDAIISVDTYKAATAHSALQAGAEIVNDVSGLAWDKSLAAVCAASGAGLVLMHTRGKPDEWKAQPKLAPDALLEMVRSGLANNLHTATAAGIATENVVLDPGYGFGKRFGENYALLANQRELLALGRPLVAGVSRKSFLVNRLAERKGPDDDVQALKEARENASLAAMTAAILNGASIVRVHAVRAAVDAAQVADSILGAITASEGAPGFGSE
jgi:dihydropteroate synthase